MPKPTVRYGRVRLVLGIVFILSVLVLLLGVQSSPQLPTPGSPAAEPPDVGLLTWLPLVTAVTSLLGFVSTTALAWRADRRAARAAALEQQRQALELEKTKAELERLKASQGQNGVRGTERGNETR
jgi:hypothetical protein